MSPDDVISLARTFCDDTPDTTEFEALLDVAYTKRNDARFWTFLLKLDTSITHATSDIWSTDHSLPSDFEEPYKVFGGAADNEYDPVPYEEILRHISAQNKYSIDYLNSKIRFTGAPGSAKTVYLWYKRLPTSLIGLNTAQKASTSTIVWPKRFCPILAFDMASMHMGGVDADEITRQQVPFLNAAHRELYLSMISWDTRRRMKMFQNSASQRRSERSEQADVISGI